MHGPAGRGNERGLGGACSCIGLNDEWSGEEGLGGARSGIGLKEDRSGGTGLGEAHSGIGLNDDRSGEMGWVESAVASTTTTLGLEWGMRDRTWQQNMLFRFIFPLRKPYQI